MAYINIVRETDRKESKSSTGRKCMNEVVGINILSIDMETLHS